MFGSDEEYQDHIRLTDESKRMRERSGAPMTSKPPRPNKPVETTPLPWEVEHNGTARTEISGPPGYLILTMNKLAPCREANAALIVKAVNNHERLLDALKSIQRIADVAKDNPRTQTTRLFDILDECSAALKQAEG